MKFSTILMAAAIFAGSSSIVLAQAAGGMAGPAPGGRGAACRDDAAKFCSDKKGPDRRACLQSNMANLSAGCKAAMSAAPAGK